MDNVQRAGARAALNRYPSLKASSSVADDGCTIVTPYLADTPGAQGADVKVMPSMSAQEVTQALVVSCRNLLGV